MASFCPCGSRDRQRQKKRKRKIEIKIEKTSALIFFLLIGEVSLGRLFILFFRGGYLFFPSFFAPALFLAPSSGVLFKLCGSCAQEVVRSARRVPAPRADAPRLKKGSQGGSCSRLHCPVTGGQVQKPPRNLFFNFQCSFYLRKCAGYSHDSKMLLSWETVE